MKLGGCAQDMESLLLLAHLRSHRLTEFVTNAPSLPHITCYQSDTLVGADFEEKIDDDNKKRVNSDGRQTTSRDNQAAVQRHF